MQVEVINGPYCPIEGTVIADDGVWYTLRIPATMPFFTTEIKVLKRNCKIIDPLDGVEDALF